MRLAWRLSSDPLFKDRLYKNVRFEARIFFGSKESKGVLDGDLAEEDMDKSEKVARELQRRSP